MLINNKIVAVLAALNAAVKLSSSEDVLAPLDQLVQSTPQQQQLQCDVTFGNTLCLRSGKHVVLPPATSDGLIARYAFDSGSVIDSSGSGFHGVGVVYPGPSPFGSNGYSAVLRAAQLSIPVLNVNSAATKEWSVAFWIFLLVDPTKSGQEDKFCSGEFMLHTYRTMPSVLARGTTVATESATASANPAIWINQSTGVIRIGLATSKDSSALEFMESNARINRQQWYRIVLTRQEKRLVLYVNGVKDSFVDTVGEVREDDGPMILGGTQESAGCDTMPMLLDDLQIWNRALGSLYIEAMSSIALGIEPARLELSCVKCTKTEAEEGCSDAYHLCSDEEMMGSGVLQAIESIGWSKLGYKVFTSGPQKGLFMQTHSPIADTNNVSTTDGGSPGLGVCCRD